MMMLRLFRESDPFNQIDQRRLDSKLTIGRDPKADWFIPDPHQALSRLHCILSLREDGAVALQDVSVNGVLVGQQRKPAPRGETMQLKANDTIRLGSYMILLEAERPEGVERAIAEVRTLHPVRTRGPQHAAGPTDGALLDAFCAGAGIDASQLANEDPLAVMRRAGEAYLQMLQGVQALTNERAAAKADARLERTTVAAAGNNPLKWTPSRVALDLLRARDDGFLAGEAALAEAFDDVHTHLACLHAAAKQGREALLDALSPARVEEQTRNQGFFLKNRAEAAWNQYQQAHAALCAAAPGARETRAEQLFREAYEQRLKDLEQTSTRI
jgi:predicted component of type VI protein secretion system